MPFKIKKVSFFSVAFSAVTIWIGFYAWRIMFNNFAVENFNASATDVGLIQAAREIPGLLAFGAGMLAVKFTESKIVAISIITVGIGLLLCGASSSLLMLGVATVIMSFGFHYFEPTNVSQLLLLSKPEEMGKTQGRLLSWESAAGLLGALLVLGLTLYLDFQISFYLFGGGVTLIGIYLLFALPSNRGKTETRKVTIKKRYWLYYTLSFLRGGRRHIFTTFAIFLMVKEHGMDITMVSMMMLANNLLTIFTNRYLGHLSDKLGERFVLAGCSSLLVIIFAGYAYITYMPILIGFYLIDNMLFGSSIALKSYLRRIASDDDLISCLSFGMTSNHITAVVVPIIGGVMWAEFGFQTTFISGAVIVFVDMLFALMVPGGKKRLTPEIVVDNA
jgi:predicted MFS family arabinose efflux permease